MMNQGCRAGHNAWKQLAGPCHSLRPSCTSRTSWTSRAVRSIESQIRSLSSTPGTSQSSQNPSTPNPEPREYNPKHKIIFSGIQPTGIPHLGNYLGALRQWKRLQDEAEPETKLIFSVVDLHAITVPRPAQELVESNTQMLAALLAIGLDPNRCTIFYQSTVPAISELQWILSCTASTGYLSRMTQWKSKMKLDSDASLEDTKAKQSLKHGLFSYPILMAADILVHRATHIPVGEDQSQHLEFARECVTNFNATYNTRCLVAPETLVSPTKRIMSLTHPTQKMSKSDPSPKSRILITDPPATIRKKIARAITDSVDSVSYDPAARPGVANLLEMLSGVDPEKRTPSQLGEEFSGQKIAVLKEEVSKALEKELGPVRERYEEVLGNERYLGYVREKGGESAGRSAAETMRKVREAVGLPVL